MLGEIGYALDTPGAYFRGLLAGKPGERVSGRDLLAPMFGSNKEGFDAGDIPGFLAEVLLDPLNVVPFGALMKGGKSLAKAARAGGPRYGTKLADVITSDTPKKAVGNLIKGTSRNAEAAGALEYLPPGSKYLGHGAEGTAFVTPNGRVIRIQPDRPYAPAQARPDLRGVMQPSHTVMTPSKLKEAYRDPLLSNRGDEVWQGIAGRRDSAGVFHPNRSSADMNAHLATSSSASDAMPSMSPFSSVGTTDAMNRWQHGIDNLQAMINDLPESQWGKYNDRLDQLRREMPSNPRSAMSEADRLQMELEDSVMRHLPASGELRSFDAAGMDSLPQGMSDVSPVSPGSFVERGPSWELGSGDWRPASGSPSRVTSGATDVAGQASQGTVQGFPNMGDTPWPKGPRRPNDAMGSAVSPVESMTPSELAELSAIREMAPELQRMLSSKDPTTKAGGGMWGLSNWIEGSPSASARSAADPVTVGSSRVLREMFDDLAGRSMNAQTHMQKIAKSKGWKRQGGVWKKGGVSRPDFEQAGFMVDNTPLGKTVDDLESAYKDKIWKQFDELPKLRKGKFVDQLRDEVADKLDYADWGDVGDQWSRTAEAKNWESIGKELAKPIDDIDLKSIADKYPQEAETLVNSIAGDKFGDVADKIIEKSRDTVQGQGVKWNDWHEGNIGVVKGMPLAMDPGFMRGTSGEIPRVTASPHNAKVSLKEKLAAKLGYRDMVRKEWEHLPTKDPTFLRAVLGTLGAYSVPKTALTE